MSLSATSTDFLKISTTSLGDLFQCLTAFSEKILLPKNQREPPLVQLEAIPSHPISCTQFILNMFKWYTSAMSTPKIPLLQCLG